MLINYTISVGLLTNSVERLRVVSSGWAWSGLQKQFVKGRESTRRFRCRANFRRAWRAGGVLGHDNHSNMVGKNQVGAVHHSLSVLWYVPLSGNPLCSIFSALRWFSLRTGLSGEVIMSVVCGVCGVSGQGVRVRSI